MNFDELVNERRSANNFVEGVEIPMEEFHEIFKMVSLGPSCFNLQHSKYIVIKDTGIKELFRERACPQYKVHTASAAVLVLGNKEAYKDSEKIYEPMKLLHMIDNVQYSNMLQQVSTLYNGRGEDFKKDEAIRNASLSAMLFMLAAKNRGWDTCPMIGFDAEAAKKLLKIGENWEPVILITMGKEDTNNRRLRGYRKPVEEFVEFI